MKTITIDDVTTNPEQAKPQIQTVRWRPDFDSPGVLPFDEAQAIKKERRPGIWYVNPVGTVHASMDSEDFLDAVRKKQREWYRLLSRQFKNRWRRERREASMEELNYGYDGVIILKGIILRLELWSKERLTNPTLNTPQSPTAVTRVASTGSHCPTVAETAQSLYSSFCS